MRKQKCVLFCWSTDMAMKVKYGSWLGDTTILRTIGFTHHGLASGMGIASTQTAVRCGRVGGKRETPIIYRNTSYTLHGTSGFCFRLPVETTRQVAVCKGVINAHFCHL